MASLSSHSSGVQSVPLETFSGRHRTLGYAVNGIPLPTQPYLATAPIVQGSTIDTGKHFTLFFSSPDSQTLALLSSGTIATLQFLLADGRAPSAKVQITSSLSGSTLLVDVLVLSDASTATATLPFLLLQQDGSTRMTQVFGEIPEDIKDKPLLGLYDPVTHSAVAAQAGTTVTDGTNSVVYAPLASSGGGGGGGSDTQYTDGGVPPTHPIGNALEFTTGSAWVTASSASAGVGFPVQEVDGANVTQGAKADSAASSDTGTFSLIALIKRVLQKLTSVVTNTSVLVDSFSSATAISAATTFSGIPTVSQLVANSSVTLANPGNQPTFLVATAVGSAFNGTLSFYGLEPDGATLQLLSAHQRGTSTIANNTAINTSSALNQVWTGNIASFKAIYVVCTTFTSGSVSVQLGLTAAPYAISITNGNANGQALMVASAPVVPASDYVGPIKRNGVAVYSLASTATSGSTQNSGDLVVAAYTEIGIDINMTAQSGTSPTIQFFWDRKGADGIYYPLYQSAVYSTATNVLSVSLGSGMSYTVSLGLTGRLRWVVGGSATPTYTFSANVYGK